MTLESPAKIAQSHRIPSLDGLRALSIFLVMALHSLQRYSLTHPVPFLWYAVFHGATGVFIFFEISGFLITTLLLKENAARGSIGLRGFYLRRAFRILPPLYLYIGVVLLLGLAGRLVLARMDILSALFFFHNLEASGRMWPIEHLWSISAEEQFYLIWPFILVYFLRRVGIPGRKAACIFPSVVIVLSPLLRVLLSRSSNPQIHHLGVSFFKFDFIMFGCLVALLQGTPRFEAFYRFATRRWWLAPSVMVLCSLLSARYQNYFDLPFGYTISGAAIAVFLLWSTRNASSLPGRILNWGPITQIGVLSYSIYLWQTLFLHVENTRIFGQGTPLHVLLGSFPGNWLAVFAVACVSYYCVELPSLRARSRLISAIQAHSRRRSQPSSTPSPR